MQIERSAPDECVSSLLETLGTPVIVSDRAGRILVVNEPAKHCMETLRSMTIAPLNLFRTSCAWIRRSSSGRWKTASTNWTC